MRLTEAEFIAQVRKDFIAQDDDFVFKSTVLRLCDIAERARQFQALLTEWDGGMYDSDDFLRRVRLALHGPLKKPEQ